MLAHANALLVGTAEGTTDYIHADIRDPESIVAAVRGRLDFDRPIALVLMGVLGHIDADEVPRIIRALVEALPSGSYLALWDGTDTDPGVPAALEEYNANAPLPYRHRSPEWIASLFDGLERAARCGRIRRTRPGPVRREERRSARDTPAGRALEWVRTRTPAGAGAGPG
ncbi:hypothetical protein GCM10009834_00180 [Streptomonospora arabica]